MAAETAAPDAATESPAPLVVCEDVCMSFDVSKPWLTRALEGAPRQTLRAVDGVHLAIPAGATAAIVGESGCGKSTLARCLVGLYRPTRGRVLIDGLDIGRLDLRQPSHRDLRHRVQMIFQDPYASLNPRWRVRDIIAEPIRSQRLMHDRAAIQDRVGELLDTVGLSARDGVKFPHEFSGGQRQRISIARALASEPEILICDEPTSALDVSVQAQILNLMARLQRDLGLTYLVISHDLAVVRHVADYIGVMYLGKLVEWGPADAVFANPRHPYTQLLLAAVPRLEPRTGDRAPVAGEVPNPIDPPPGCAFNPRCPHASERCRSEPPPLLGGDGVDVACHAVAEGRI